MSAQRPQVPEAQHGGFRRNPLHVVLATCVVCAAAALLSGFAVLRHGAHLDAGHASIGLLQQPSSSNGRTRSARSEPAGILSAGEDSDRRLPFVSASSLGLYNRLKAISKNIVSRRIAQSLRSRIAAGGSKALKPAVLTQLAATKTPPASLGRAPADDASAGPWEFPGEPGLFSALKRRLGQVPDLVADHIHNEEFENVLDHCRNDVSCSALLPRGFWWLYGKPWRRCNRDSAPWACIPYHCAANQVGTTPCRILDGGPVQALVNLDVRCWDTGRSLWEFSMTRTGCKDFLPWRGGTGSKEYLRVGYNCHGCDDGHDGCPGEPTLDAGRPCSFHWTACAPGSGPGRTRTGGNLGGSGRLGENEWLKAHVVQCPPNTYISEWRLTRERCAAGDLRIRYRCCERYWGPCRTLSTTGSSSKWADGLEGHDVRCNGATESLNHFQWTGSNFKYTCCCENNCCRPAFGGGRARAQPGYWPAGYHHPVHAPEPARPEDPAVARPPPDAPKWMRGALGPGPHSEDTPDGGGDSKSGRDGRGRVWKSDPMQQLQYMSEHLDGHHDAK